MEKPDQIFEFVIVTFNKRQTLIKQFHAALLYCGYGISELRSDYLEMLFNLSVVGDFSGFFIVNMSDKGGKVDSYFYQHILELSKKLGQCGLLNSVKCTSREFNSLRVSGLYGILETMQSYGITARGLIAKDAIIFLKQ